MSAKQISISLPNMTLAALAWGDSSKAPILALHGWLDNAASFTHLAPRLKDHYVVAVDMPGHGLSPHLPTGMRYHFLDAVDVVLQILDAMQWQDVILMGHSLGGAVASVVAASFSERVKKLVAIDSIGPLSEESLEAPGRLHRALQMFKNAERMKLKTYLSFEEMVRLRERINTVPAELITPLVERAAKSTDAGYQWRYDPALSLPSLSYFTEQQVLSFLKAIHLPVLLLEADQGVIADSDLLLTRKQAFPQLQVVEIEGCHHIHLTESELLSLHITTFLQQ